MVAENKTLNSEQVLEKVRGYSPALANHLRVDRSWVWYVGPSLKESPKARAKMLELGFRFAKQPHQFADGTVDENARWYHPCGGPVFRRNRTAQPQHQRSTAPSLSDELASVFGA